MSDNEILAARMAAVVRLALKQIRTAEDGWNDDDVYDLVDAAENLAAMVAPLPATREEIIESYAHACHQLGQEIGVRFAVIDNGGGTLAISGDVGVVRVLVTDWEDGDLSRLEDGVGWWVGFSLPDAPWTGRTESLIGDPDARGVDGLVKLVAFAVSSYLRGERHTDFTDGVARIDYEGEK